MKKILFLLSFTLVITSFISCERSDGKKALGEMKKIVVKAEKEKDKLSDDEWKVLSEKFQEKEQIVKEAVEKDELGFSSKLEYITLTTRWATAYGERFFNDLRDELSDDKDGTIEKISGELEKMFNSLDKDSDK